MHQARVAALALVSTVLAASLPAAAEDAPPPPRIDDRPAPHVPPVMARRSDAAMVAGIVLTSVSGALLITAAAGESTVTQCEGGFAAPCNNSFTGIAVGLVIGAVVGLAVGIPVLVHGAKQVPLAPASAPPQGQALPTWVGAPGGTGWVWRF